MTASARRLRIAVIVLAGVLASVGLAAIALAAMLSPLSKAEVLPEVFPEELTRPSPGPPAVYNILVLGSDSRDTAVGPVDQIRDQRSDTMMLIHIPADRDSVSIMSLMRDSWVEIPGHGNAKINAALAIGGVPLVVQTVESLISARVDHVAVVDFVAFRGITDALGGITVNDPRAFTSSHLRGHFFEYGELTLTGDEALAFVRERYAFADGDYQRVRNQQLFVKAMIDTALSAETLTDPGRVFALVDAIAPKLATDDGLDASFATALAFELRGIRSDDIQFFTLPTLGIGTEGDQSVVKVDFAGLEEVRKAYAAGTVAEYARTH